MKISILTLFPEFFDGFLTNSIIKRALAKQLVDIEIINIRDFTNDKYGRVDSAPVGGGAGLIMKCQPVLDCLKSVRKENSHVVLLSPRGKTYNQARARYFASKIEHLVIICGHYEGTDERINKHVDELVSIGDYILTGGEITDYSNIHSSPNHLIMKEMSFQTSSIQVIIKPLKNGEKKSHSN